MEKRGMESQGKAFLITSTLEILCQTDLNRFILWSTSQNLGYDKTNLSGAVCLLVFVFVETCLGTCSFKPAIICFTSLSRKWLEGSNKHTSAKVLGTGWFITRLLGTLAHNLVFRIQFIPRPPIQYGSVWSGENFQTTEKRKHKGKHEETPGSRE